MYVCGRVAYLMCVITIACTHYIERRNSNPHSFLLSISISQLLNLRGTGSHFDIHSLLLLPLLFIFLIFIFRTMLNPRFSSLLLLSLYSTSILASNDWSKPCFNGICSYDLPDTPSGPSGTLKIVRSSP